jgi:hypothetical protein
VVSHPTHRSAPFTYHLARFALGPLLAQYLDALGRQLQAFSSKLGARSNQFEVAESMRISHLLAQFFQEWMYLGEDQEQLTTASRLEK